MQFQTDQAWEHQVSCCILCNSTSKLNKVPLAHMKMKWVKNVFNLICCNLQEPCTYVTILFVRAVEQLMNCVLSFCRGIFKLLVKFQLENKDNPSYSGTRTHILTLNPVRIISWMYDLFYFMIVMFSHHFAKDCHSKISTSVVERRSWWILTSHWGLNWLSSETTNWSVHARWSLVSL